jgi:hypothetical protein
MNLNNCDLFVPVNDPKGILMTKEGFLENCFFVDSSILQSEYGNKAYFARVTWLQEHKII